MTKILSHLGPGPAVGSQSALCQEQVLGAPLTSVLANHLHPPAIRSRRFSCKTFSSDAFHGTKSALSGMDLQFLSPGSSAMTGHKLTVITVYITHPPTSLAERWGRAVLPMRRGEGGVKLKDSSTPSCCHLPKSIHHPSMRIYQCMVSSAISL